MSYIDDLNALKAYLSTGPALDSQADAVILLYKVLSGLDRLDNLSNLSNILTLLQNINTNVSDLANANSLEDIQAALFEAIKNIPSTTTVYVSPGGDDTNSGNQFSPVQTLTVAIEKAVALNPSLNNPVEIKLAPGHYLIQAPLILPRDISLAADAPNTVYIKPTNATEDNNLVLVDSNSTINNINFTGHQNGAFAIALNGTVDNLGLGAQTIGAFITRPVLVTNCSSMTSSAGQVVEGLLVNTELSGGSIEIDGNKCASNSPSKAILVNNFTSVNYNGLGFLVKNSGQGHFNQCVSSYCQYHLRCESGGLAFVNSNINNYGTQGLVATGYNTTSEGAGDIEGLIAQRTINITNLSTGAKLYKGSLIKVGGNVYKVKELNETAGGYQATIDRDLVNTLSFSRGTFHKVSKVLAVNHFFNHIGSGVDYRALAENNTLDIPENKAVESNEGIVIYTSMDSEGNINLSNSITIDGTSGEVVISNTNILGLDDLEANFRLDEETNEVTQNITNTPDGIVPKPFSFNPYNFTSEQIQLLANRINGGSTYQIYVDIDNPNASDSKHNRGNTPQRPFRTLERALIETARRSFAKGTNNDIYNRVSIYVAPGIYRLNNGRGGVTESEFYNRYQDAANLILMNLDNIADAAYGSFNFVADDSLSLRTALKSIVYSAINYLADDLSSLGNKQIVSFARTFVRFDAPDPGTAEYSQENYLNPFYYNLIFDNNGDVRNNSLISGLINAFYSIRDNATLAMRNQGAVTDPDIIVDPVNPKCANVASSISTLIDILARALNPQVSGHNPYNININVGSMLREFPEEGEPSDEILQSFNDPVVPGIILPRGVSIIGADLRKVIFKPKYVPAPFDDLVPRSSIFRMTGGNFFQGFTILDQDPIDRNYENATSHHKLTGFAFCTLNDLELYYNTVTVAFADRSIYNKAQDASNLLEANYDWLIKRLPLPGEPAANLKRYKEIFIAQLPYFIQSLILDLQQLGKTNVQKYANKFLNLHINTLEPNFKQAAVDFYKLQIDNTFDYLVQAINNLANETEGGVRDYRIIFDNSPQGQCTDVVNAIRNYLDIMKAIISEQIEPDLINDRFSQADSEVRDKETSIVIPPNALTNPVLADTVQGASPYIFSASVRSEYGMCGIDGDGALVSGLKSYLAAQFTIISLQKDEAVFTPRGAENEVKRVRYQGSKLTDFSDPTLSDCRHFGYRVVNGAYSQLVSCFCICPAVHYWTGSGGEFSITNSTSNFGDISLYAEGYNTTAYTQDQGVDLIGIVKPKDIEDIRTLNAENADIFPLGVIESLEDLEGNIRKITLSGLAQYLDRYTIDNNLRPEGEPDRISFVYVSSVSNVDRKGSVLSTELNETGTKTIITVDITNGGFWTTDRLDTTESTVIGKQLFIKRFVDTRKPLDREYHLVLKRDLPLIGKRRPVIHFVIQKSVEANQEQPFALDYQDTRSVFYVLNIDNTDILEQTGEVCYLMRIATLNATNLGEIETETDLETNTVLDLDYDPSDPSLANVLNKDTYSRQNLETFLNKVGLSSVISQLNITSNNIIDLRAQNVSLDFLKPSIIRCGSQTWEYMGYYNYSSGLPAFQFRKLGEDLTSEALVKLFRISKTQTSILGGRIYATGIDEEGNSYVGNTIIDLKTGKQEEIIRGSSQEVLLAFDTPDIVFPTFYDNLTVDNLEVTGQISGNLTVEGDLTINGAINTSALPIADDTNLGIVKLATDAEVIGETDNESVITPAKLKKWRIANKLVTNLSTSSVVYVSNRRDSNGNYLGHSAAQSYKVQYGSNHGAAISAQDYLDNINNPNNEGNFVQLSNPAAPNFRCLSGMDQVAAYGNGNLSTKDQLRLVMDPGKYRADYGYNFGFIINGANDKGVDGWGNPDGSDIAEDGSAGGVILYVTVNVGLESSTSTLAWNPNTINITSDSQTIIQFVHIWSWITAVKDLDTEWYIKARNENTLEQCLVRANQVAYAAYPTYLRSVYNACWEGFNRMKPVIKLFGTGRKSFYFTTFSGLGVQVNSSNRSGVYTGAYINTYNDCRLDLGAIVLRGNEEIRFSDKHGRAVKTPENTTPVIVPNNIYRNQPNTWTYEPIYNTDGTVNYNSFYGGNHTSGFFHDPFNQEWVSIGFCEAFLTVTRNTVLHFSVYNRGSSVSHFGDTTLSPYGTRDNRLTYLTTHNSDLHCIRLEKNTSTLYGQEDERIVNGLTSINEVDLLAKISYRGTDNLGYKINDLYPPTISYSNGQFGNQAAWEAWVEKYKNQGPVLEYFTNSNSFQLNSSYTLWGSDFMTFPRSPGFLGQFGYKLIISDKRLVNIETHKLLDYSVYPRSVNLGNGQGAKLMLGTHDSNTIMQPAWKGFKDRYASPVFVDVLSNFSSIATDIDNNNFNSAIALITGPSNGHILDGSNVGARFCLIGSQASENRNIIYIGYYFEGAEKKYYFAPFQVPTTNNALGEYLAVRNAHSPQTENPRIFNTFNDLLNANLSVEAGTKVYVKECSMGFSRVVVKSTDHGSNQPYSWAPASEFSVPSLMTEIAWRTLNIAINSINAGYYLDKTGYEANGWTNYGIKTEIPTIPQLAAGWNANTTYKGLDVSNTFNI